MNIYEKLALARVELQELNLRKSGRNNFAKFNYFELSDILPPINRIMAKYKMLGVCSFTSEEATLTIFDAEKPDNWVVFRSPQAEADLKGCNDIQKLGGAETYQRRYLWMMAFEIVEQDEFDAMVGKQTDDDPIGAGVPAPPIAPREDVCQGCGTVMTKAQLTLAKKYAADYSGRLLCADCRAKEDLDA